MKVILIILSLILITINFLEITGEKKNIKKKNFKEILSDKKDNIENYEVEIGKLRKELSETIIELQREIYDLKDEVSRLKFYNRPKIQLKSRGDENLNEYTKSDESVDFTNNSVIVNKIKELLAENKSDEEICSLLDIGKGELLLVKGLYKC